ncbi:MAG: hypothetical protein IKN47_02800 [Lachnospiraceae bacterium]|nr:hypothetical protein [Lachnospiraceae bacterium]
MKPLKESIFFKVLIILIILIAAVFLIYLNHCTKLDREAAAKNAREYNEAVNAGYDEMYTVCSKEDTVTIEGVTYQRFTVLKKALIGEGASREILFLPGSVYIDESYGNTQGLAIYARSVTTDSETGESMRHLPGNYIVVEPYKVAVYNTRTSVIGLVVAMAVAGYVELLLIIVLITYVIAYFVLKRKKDGI